MRTSVLKVYREYDKDEIRNYLKPLRTERGLGTGKLFTLYNDKQINETKVSDRYYDFDFGTFTSAVLREIENYFVPLHYNLKINKGFQELRLIGDAVMIDGEHYSKMFNILNSTDKTRALQQNVGLIRSICNNGLVVGVEGEMVNMRGKHFYKSLPEKISEFKEHVCRFNIIIDKQVDIVDGLRHIDVSFKYLVMKLLQLDVNDIDVLESNRLRLKAFCKKLVSSRTDRMKQVTGDEMKLLRDPEEAMYNGTTFDITLPGSQVFNVYTEIFRGYNSAILNTETNRILNIIT